jgi:oligopeptide/dipeptide ABC transporter ATP-binding protein
MRLLGGTGRIEAGEIRFGDLGMQDLSESQMRKIRGHKIAMIFQDPMTSLNPYLRVGRQITEAIRLHLGLDAAAALQRAIEMLKAVHIPGAEDRIDDYPHQFSGGMRQRVMIAMALSCEPQILIADEPTTALDVTIQAQILDLLREIRDTRGTAIILITHDLGVVAETCHRVLVMYAGRIVEEAAVRDLFRSPKHPYTVGLLKSLPTYSGEKHRLVPIDGQPPDLLHLPIGCAFAARCFRRKDRCEAELPLLHLEGEDHTAACFYPVENGIPLKEHR